MNTMMMALLQGRLWDSASSLQQRLHAHKAESEEPAIAGELSQVMQALEALHSGRYGDCTECGEAIDLDRLLRQPHKMQCPHCESARGTRLDAYTVEAWKFPASTPQAQAPSRF
jgi:RNA polymerase-binding transcription factor DksA